MPPKKQDAKSLKGQQRAAEKEKAKIVEDKTFGLKNKNKSKAVQKKIKGIQQQATGNNKEDRMKEERQQQQKEAKKSKAQQDALLASLFRGTENVKKMAAAENEAFDPLKSRQEQKIDLYVDQREQKREMDDWDQTKLEEVVKSKHVKQAAMQNNSTDIICKHFLDAVEKRQYGWFWTCPNKGEECKYKHCLPPGFVLKKDIPADIDEEDEEPIEEVIERLRAELPSGGTPVTKETFEAWKKKKEDDRLAELQAMRDAALKKPGKGNALSGRDLFTFDPSLFIDDAGAASDADYDEDEEGYNSDENEQDAEEGDNDEEEDVGVDDADEDEPVDKHKSEPSQPSNVDNVAPLKEELFLHDDELPDDLDALDL